jgi:hypothetical protein
MKYCYIPKDYNNIKNGWYELLNLDNPFYYITLYKTFTVVSVKDKEKIKNINKKESIVILEENIIEVNKPKICPVVLEENTIEVNKPKICPKVYYIKDNKIYYTKSNNVYYIKTKTTSSLKYTDYIKDMVQEKIVKTEGE